MAGNSRFMLVVSAAALVLGLFEVVQLIVRSATNGQPVPWGEALVLTLPRWLLLALLAPGVREVTARRPFGRGVWRRAILAHGPAAIAFAVTHLALCVVVYGFLLEGVPNRFPSRLSNLLTWYFAGDLFVYGAMAGVLTAIRLARESRDREVHASQLMARLTEARLDALRAQLEPHFLFNALNATSVLARKGDSNGVVRMLESIGDLLRGSLDPGLPHEIPLARELALLDAYTRIQSVRFSDRLTLVREIDDETLNALVPSMILQPLVENAARHGIAERPGPGKVTIGACRSGQSLRLEVRDTGPGFEQGSRAAEGRSGHGLGIGLANTRARLEHLYGQDQRVETGDLDSGGAFVSVTIPWRTAEEPS